MIFGRRLGCVASQATLSSGQESRSTIHEFVHCMRQLFEESSRMTVIPAKLAYKLNLPVWQRFMKAAETALSLGKRFTHNDACLYVIILCLFPLFFIPYSARTYVEQNVQDMLSASAVHNNRCPLHNITSGGVLSQQGKGVLDLLTNKEKIDKDEVVNIITDLFLAAADTVSILLLYHPVPHHLMPD